MQGSETNSQASDTANMSAELGLDPSDPLNLLLQSNSADSESISSQGESPPDWSQFSALWPPSSIEVGNGAHFSGGNENVKFSDFGMDFDLSVPMDLDFSNTGISIDPNALHFNNKDFQQSTFGVPLQSHELYSAPFPFTFSSPSLSSASTSSEHTDEEVRASIHSVTESPPMTEYYPAAVPQALAAVQAKLPIPRLARPAKPAPTPKPAKRSTKSPSQPQSHVSSSASSSPSPGPSSPNSNSDSTQSASTAQATSVIPRPKTSHTTIERRYRTNLNARIKSLRQAVPALRVLEQNNIGEEYVIDERGFVDGVKVARKGSKANVLGKAVEYIRVLKKREARLKREQNGLRSLVCGLVGGAALLTNWEREWVEKYGGPEKDELDDDDADEASDEDDAEGDGEDEGDDEERARKKVKVAKVSAQKKDGRKTATAASSVISVGGEMMGAAVGMVVPEKRKRGRPRKNPPAPVPPVTASAPVVLSAPPVAQEMNMSMMHPQMHSQGMPAQQYLLAVFALFSFFKSPLASSMSAQHAHTHTGSVLSDINVELPNSSILSSKQWNWNDFVQAVHLIVSLLVFATIVFPWLPLPRGLRHTRLMRLLSFGSISRDTRGSARGGFAAHTSANALPTPPTSPSASDSESDTDSLSSTEELHVHSHDNVHATNPLAGAIAKKGSPDEIDHLVAALGLGCGVFGLARGTFTMGRKRSKDKNVDRELVRRAWIRLSELFAMNVSRNTPVTARLQTYLQSSSLLGSSAKSAIHYASDLCTVALLARCIPLPFADSRAEALWNRAKAHESKLVQPYERLVLNSITLKEAATRLRDTTLPTINSPLRALATSLVLDRVREHASVLFVRTASPDEDVSGNTWAFSEQNDKRGEKDEEKRWRETISAGRSLGGQVGALVDAFEKAWQSGELDIDELLANDQEGDCIEIAALLNAIVLYRQVFPPSVLSCTAVSAVEDDSAQSILSPPPSPSAGRSGLAPTSYDKDAVLKLRRALGSSAFDFREVERKELEQGAQVKLGETLEETRDRVVDLLVEYERRGRGRICKFNS